MRNLGKIIGFFQESFSKIEAGHKRDVQRTAQQPLAARYRTYTGHERLSTPYIKGRNKERNPYPCSFDSHNSPSAEDPRQTTAFSASPHTYRQPAESLKIHRVKNKFFPIIFTNLSHHLHSNDGLFSAPSRKLRKTDGFFYFFPYL